MKIKKPIAPLAVTPAFFETAEEIVGENAPLLDKLQQMLALNDVCRESGVTPFLRAARAAVEVAMVEKDPDVDRYSPGEGKRKWERGEALRTAIRLAPIQMVSKWMSTPVTEIMDKAYGLDRQALAMVRIMSATGAPSGEILDRLATAEKSLQNPEGVKIAEIDLLAIQRALGLKAALVPPIESCEVAKAALAGGTVDSIVASTGRPYGTVNKIVSGQRGALAPLRSMLEALAAESSPEEAARCVGVFQPEAAAWALRMTQSKKRKKAA